MDNLSEIKLIRQTPKTNDCLRCCAQMIFKYFDDPIKKEVIWKKLHSYKKFSGLEGSFLTDLGLLAIKLGYKTVLGHYDWHWWDKTAFEANNRSSKALAIALKDLKKEKGDWADKKIITKEIQYLEKKGTILNEIPNLGIVDNYLIQNIPVILLVDAQDFYQSPKEEYNHAILIVGKKTNSYLIKDPLMAVEEINKEQLFLAWLRNGARMMVILPKETSQKIKQPELKF